MATCTECLEGGTTTHSTHILISDPFACCKQAFHFHFHFLLGPKNRNINEKSKKILIIANMKNKVSLAFNVSEKGSKYAQQHDKN